MSVTFEGPENEENYAEQNKMISRAAENGADVIVLSAIGQNALRADCKCRCKKRSQGNSG